MLTATFQGTCQKYCPDTVFPAAPDIVTQPEDPADLRRLSRDRPKFRNISVSAGHH
jgi:hypothetical protein